MALWSNTDADESKPKISDHSKETSIWNRKCWELGSSFGIRW